MTCGTQIWSVVYRQLLGENTMADNNIMRTAVRRAVLFGLATAGAACATHGLAQDPGSGNTGRAGAGPMLEEVMVTGSRLRRDRDAIASSPVQTIDLEMVQLSGSVTLENTLNKFPQVKPSNTSTTNQSGGAGVLSADLRGLGAVRTLVLVDGKRFIPGDVTGLVDLATIPDLLIQRVEVITGGASAVYGSDAIAGAVNFVLRDDFEGFELRGQYGETRREDGENSKIDFLLGANLADDRGNVTMHGSYTKREEVFFGSRSFSRQPLLANSEGELENFGVGTIPGALIGVSAADLDRIDAVDLTNSDGSCPGPIQGVRFEDGSVPQPFCRPEDQYNYAPPNYLLRPLERWQIGAMGHFDINNRVSAYGQAFYTRKDNAWQQAPEALNPASPGQEPGTLLIPNADTNPLFSPALQEFFAANRDYFDPMDTGTFTVRNVAWQIAEFGPRNSRIVSDSLAFTGGFRGEFEFAGGTWGWDAFYQYASADVSTNQQGRLSRSRLSAGLDVVIEDGVPRCRVGDLLNCVPVSIFGTDALTDEMVNYLRISTGSQDDFTRNVAGFSVAGDLFELPAGRVSAAFGGEYRKEEFSVVPALPALTGDLGSSGVLPQINGGEFDIYEVFAETRVPLLSELPAVQSLAFEGAARFSDYSTIGSVTTWKTALDWQIVEDVRARASLSRAIRAPNLNELFSVPGSGFVGGVDPCLASQSPTEAQKDLCVAQGVPAELRDSLQTGASEGFQVISGGNESLEEEEADTLTLGLVYTPQAVPGLFVTLDYFQIEVDSAISQVAAQTLVNTCFETLAADSLPCQSISRLTSGNIFEVRAPLLNVATREVSGIDLQVNYSTELPTYLALPGRGATLDLMLVATEQFDDKTQALEGQPEVDCAGFYGGPCSGDAVRITPDFRALLRADWRSGPLHVAAEVTHIGDLELHPLAFPNEVDELDTWTYLDLTASLNVTGNINLFAGMNNVFDKQPPVLGFRAGGDHSTNPQLFDPLGRRFFLGASVSF
jgi:outer membrane receptor protein involved in Fe transport